MRIKGVIFDLDGTIIDTLGTYTQAFNQGLGKFNLETVPKKELAVLLNEGLPLKEIIRRRYPSLPPEMPSECFEEIRKAYLELEEDGVHLQPGAREALSQLKAMGLKIGIATGRTTEGERSWLELRRLNADQFIDAMVTSAALAHRKPAPDGLIECMKELGLSAQECVFVGDSRADILTGKAAGVRTVAVTTGVAEGEALAQEGPDDIINSLAELPVLIRSLERDEADR